MSILKAGIAQIRTVVAALTPVTGDTLFAPIDGLLPLDDEPPVASDRTFSVEMDGADSTGLMWGNSARQGIADVRVRVRYDAQGDVAACEDRMSEDRSQIIAAVENPTNRATGSWLVEVVGGDIDRAVPDFPVMSIVFRIVYAQ